MAKKTKTDAKKKVGPFLACAFFCERVIDDKSDGVPSIIRIIDTVTLHLEPTTPDDVPSEKNRIPIPLTGYLGFRTGDCPGEHILRLVTESPTGKSKQIAERPIILPHEWHGGFNLKLNVNLMLAAPGVHKIHVFLGPKKYTVMPIMVAVKKDEPIFPIPDHK